MIARNERADTIWATLTATGGAAGSGSGRARC